MAEIVIFGIGDIASLAHHYFSTDSPHQVAAFTVDAEYRTSDDLFGRPVIDFATVHEAYPPDRYQMFIAISYARMNQVRTEKYLAARDRGYTLASYISSRCTQLTQFPIGQNCFILEDNTIQPFVRIGDNVTLWSGNHIGHHSTIGDHCFISSHVVVSGHCHIGESCFLGVNATLRNGIRLGARTLVGAAASIMSDTDEGSVYLGGHAKRFSKDSSEIDL